MKLCRTLLVINKVFFLSIFATLFLFSCAKSGSGVAPSNDILPSPINGSKPDTTSLTITPATALLSVNNSRVFSAAGGDGSYSFSVLSGSGSVNASSGSFTAGVASGVTIVSVSDGSGLHADATITVNAALQISPASLNLGLNVVQNFSSSGGVPPYAYSILSGAGSVVAGTGQFTAPNVAGTTVLRVTDALSNTSDATLTITAALVLNSLQATLAVNNSTTLSASGGLAPYVYSIVSGGGSLNSSTGAYTAPAIAGAVVVRVTDALSATADLNLTVNSALQLSPSTITIATLATTGFSASGGVPPYVYSLTSGAGSIDSATGIYTAANAGGVAHVRVTDALSNTANATVNINSAPTITSISDMTIYEGRPSAIHFTLADADGALTCTSANLSATSSNAVLLPVSNIIFSGSYPNCTATLSLAAAQSGTSNISINVTDSIATANSNFVVTGQKISSVALSPLTPIVPKNSNFSFTLTATYSDASTKNITTTSTWATSNSAISSFTSAGVLNNTYAGVAVATSTITATYGSFTANTLATINPATVTSLIVDITSATMNVNGTLQVKCYGLTSDGGSLDLTASCSWASANSLIVSVDNSVDKGLVTAVSLGSATNITATYGAFTANSAVTVDVTAPVTSDNGLGLTAKYFSDKTLTTLANTRIDANVNFNWAVGNNPAGNADSFSVRWTGFIKAPVTGTYTFYTQSDDGTRLWVNGTQVVNNWTDHSSVENSGTISLVAGQKYPVTLEFYENGGYAVMQLSYSAAGVAKQIIPQINLYPY